ncbi:hypothetical protein MBLNU459_g1017t1 [Dothideomycetes sp. NU459]
MVLRSRRRILRSRAVRLLALLVPLFCIWEVSTVRRALLRNDFTDEDTSLYYHGKIFVVSLPWNNEIILRSHWNAQLVDLVKKLGPSNVYVSIYENGSYDNTKDAIGLLDEELGVAGIRRHIVLEDKSHVDLMAGGGGGQQSEGWVRTPRGRKELRRIPYLSQLRNVAMKPLLDLAANGEYFDKVLFLNDVVFTTEDALQLLSTRKGEYATACALDFESPPAFYDTFALRDSEGHGHLMQSWPYFRARESRRAIVASEPARVSSCWNGLVAMDAGPFYDGLAFRGVPDSLAQAHVEGSECCLIHADNSGGSAASRSKGVWVNPNVRVGYCHALMHVEPAKYGDYCSLAYDYVHARSPWLSASEIFVGLWQNRLRRWFTTPWFGEARISRTVDAWRAEHKGRQEKGSFCLVDEMHVIRGNGWVRTASKQRP